MTNFDEEGNLNPDRKKFVSASEVRGERTRSVSGQHDNVYHVTLVCLWEEEERKKKKKMMMVMIIMRWCVSVCRRREDQGAEVTSDARDE